MHSSAHASGQTHYSLSRRARRGLDPNAPRLFDVHSHPHRLADGVSHFHTVTVAATELTFDYEERTTPSEVTDVAVPAGAQAVSINTYLVEPGAVVVAFPEGIPVARLGQSDGGEVLVMATPEPLAQHIHRSLDEDVESIVRFLSEHPSIPLPTRFVVMLTDPDAPGVKREVEILIRRGDLQR
jgi:hypothetical protein